MINILCYIIKVHQGKVYTTTPLHYSYTLRSLILCCDISYYSVCTVHGFASTSYDVEEGERLDTTFGLNVKGTTSLPLVILGTITLEPGTTSE